MRPTQYVAGPRRYRSGFCTEHLIRSGATQQIVGRERNQRACHRQLVRNVVVARRVNSTVMLLLYSMKHTISIGLVLCFALLCASCMWSPETSFFSNFSVRQLVERSKSSAGLTCDPIGGGGGGIGSRAGGMGFGGTQFNSHKSDSCGCSLKSNETFDETRLFSALKLDVERALHDNGAQITDSGSSGPANFYFAYAVKNVRGRFQLSGTRIGTDYYDVRADLEENGN
jgi:hypothetical protein